MEFLKILIESKEAAIGTIVSSTFILLTVHTALYFQTKTKNKCELDKIAKNFPPPMPYKKKENKKENE